MKIKKDLIISVIVLTLIIIIPILGFQPDKAPQVVPENAPPTEFSAERAMKHMKHIASKSHPIGSEEHEKVYQYIISRLKEMGYEPELQTTEGFYPLGILPTVARVKNIVVKIQGKEAGKSVLVMGHYDSVETAPGASDDGSAIVSMLETLRLLKLALLI